MSAASGLSLARIFEVMEREKGRLGVLDYSASQPSLESIFLAIAERDITLDRNRKAQLGGLPGEHAGGQEAHDASQPGGLPGQNAAASAGRALVGNGGGPAGSDGGNSGDGGNGYGCQGSGDGIAGLRASVVAALPGAAARWPSSPRLGSPRTLSPRPSFGRAPAEEPVTL